ncbi:MAG: glutaredoxin family protein [Acidothermus sp.]|nr:glutaredoxin family protein [Acidothermus sp.]
MGPRIVLYGKPGCHLCDEARLIVAAVAAEFGEEFTERDIRDDPEDLREYGEWIPVVVVDGVEIGRLRIRTEDLRRALSR